MSEKIIGLEGGKTPSETADICHNLHHSGFIPVYEDIISDNYLSFLNEGDIAVDIGVNHGLHYDRLTAKVAPGGHVIGFEPVPDFVSVVKEKHGDGVDVRQKALSTQPGHGSFFHMTAAIGESGFKERESEGNRGAKKIEVEISTLDIELPDLEKLAFIKIDVEGHEISVLKGGEKLIQRTRPIIAIEYGKPTYSLYGLTAESLYDWASSVDYCLSDLWGNVVRSKAEWNYVCDRSYWDYFIVPREKAEWWVELHSNR